MVYQPEDPQSLHPRFRAAISPEALRTIAAVVAWGHVRAPVHCEEHFGRVGKARSGLVRWIQTDAHLDSLRNTFPGVTIELKDNLFGGGVHIEITAGDFLIILTHDADPDAPVPLSEYGKLLVKSNQIDLFEDPDEQRLTPPRICVVLFHSKAEIKGSIPDRLEIRFPDNAGGYAADALKLYDEFPVLMDESWLLTESARWGVVREPAKEERIMEEALPKLRRAEQSGS